MDGGNWEHSVYSFFFFLLVPEESHFNFPIKQPPGLRYCHKPDSSSGALYDHHKLILGILLDSYFWCSQAGWKKAWKHGLVMSQDVHRQATIGNNCDKAPASLTTHLESSKNRRLGAWGGEWGQRRNAAPLLSLGRWQEIWPQQSRDETNVALCSMSFPHYGSNVPDIAPASVFLSVCESLVLATGIHFFFYFDGEVFSVCLLFWNTMIVETKLV